MVVKKRKSIKVHFPKDWKKNKKTFKNNEEITSDEQSSGEENLLKESRENEASDQTLVNKNLQEIDKKLDDLKNNNFSTEKNDTLLSFDPNLFKQNDQFNQRGERSTVVYKNICDSILEDLSEKQDLKSTRKSVTCAVVSSCSRFLAVGCKDGLIIKYELENECLKLAGRIKAKKRNYKVNNPDFKWPKGSILCLALSHDDKFLVSSSEDSKIFIWDFSSLSFINILHGHRGNVTGLAFQNNSFLLFSCSSDKTIKIWNVEKVGFIDTLYGHENCPVSIDSLLKERALSAGGLDASLRLWKIPEQSQLVFSLEKGESQLCVAMLSETHFVSSSDKGSLYLWQIDKKKPIFVFPRAHTGFSLISSPNDDTNKSLFEISAISVVPFSDMIATGSYDGFINFFKFLPDTCSLKPVLSLPMNGHINYLRFSSDGKLLLAARGREQRLGRWITFPNSEYNGVGIIRFKK